MLLPIQQYCWTGVEPWSPGEAQSLLFSLNIYGLVEFFDVLGDVLGHLSAALVLNQVNRSDPAAGGVKASSERFPRRFAEGDDVSLTRRRCADDLLGILLKLPRLLGRQLRVHLFQLLLPFSEHLPLGAFLRLGLRTERWARVSLQSNVWESRLPSVWRWSLVNEFCPLWSEEPLIAASL